MKKILFALSLLVFITSCDEKLGTNEQTPNEENSQKPVPAPEQKPEQEPETLNIEGVWRDGAFFVSFGADGYYSAHLHEEHLDTGAYTVKDNTITCKNNYNGKQTIYNVKQLSESALECTASYEPYNADTVTEERAFSKSNETPAAKEHILVYKSWGYLSSNYDTITIEFKSHYTATQSSSKDSRYVNEWYYTYIEPYIYVQSFTPNDGKQHPSTSFSKGNDSGEVVRKIVSLRDGELIGVSNE